MRDILEQNQVLKLAVGNILPNPYQPRRYFDIVAIEELANSIKQFGVIQPITVRHSGNGLYELVSGERRLRACKSIGLAVIPAIVVGISESEQAVIALLENLQRKDLNFFEEAEGYVHLINYHGLTQEAVAAKIGVTQSTIANKIRLLRLDNQLREYILQSGLTERHARALLKQPDADKRMSIAMKVVERGLNVQATESLIEQELQKQQLAKRKSIYRANRNANRDYRVFVNTINEALSMIKKAGVPTRSKQIEHDKYFEYVIYIEK